MGPILLKFRFFAARLGSQPLENWIKHELEGYPLDVEVPEYRKLQIVYSGTFSGAFGSGINNASIPSYLIDKFAGKNWTCYQMRQSIAAVDDLVRRSNDGGTLQIDASNLILMLQGKIYEDYSCVDVSGQFSASQLRELQHSVKSRLLELLIEFENIPGALDISIEPSTALSKTEARGKVTQIFHQTIQGSMTNINNSGSINSINVLNKKGIPSELVEQLIQHGITENDAREFAEIVRSEQPDSLQEPFGKKAKQWIAANLKKAANGTWKAGIGVATDVLKQAAINYYGLS